MPRKVALPIAAAALGLLILALAARAFPPVKNTLWTGLVTLFPGADTMHVDLKNAETRLRAELAAGLALPLPQARIVIRKQARRLDLYSGPQRIKTYPVTLGRHPQGTKVRQGDGATPEGRYFICTRNARSRFHLFLGLSYPNAADGARGLENRLLDEAQRTALAAAEAARQRPPWDTPLGGEIGIHGGGTQPPDWTFGCIALADPDIEELWLAAPMGTPVEILP